MYGFDGQLVEGKTPGDLTPLEFTRHGRILLRAGGGPSGRSAACRRPRGRRSPTLLPREVTDQRWRRTGSCWSSNGSRSPQPQQHFLPPNQLLEVRAAGAVILQVIPTAPGRSRLRRFDFAAQESDKRTSRGAREGWRREIDGWLAAQVAVAESTQSGLVGAAAEPGDPGPITPALAQFREALRRRSCTRYRLGEACRRARQACLGNALAQQVVELQHAVLQA